ncbi:amidohydrolase family protein [Hyphomicrobium sp.]|uniref:amidohydrolase family protein n=1 Tax=Hyphomicrobium sp. TaxID=82 RepID=UPI002FDF8B2B
MNTLLHEAKTLILEPSWALIYEGGELELRADHSVVVQDGHIADIVPGRVRGQDTRFPMPGELLIPGMISGHTHVAGGSCSRGLIESGRLWSGPLFAIETLDDDDLDALTAYNLAEILRGGCTTQVEQSLSLKQMKSYVRVARAWGVRGYPGGMVPGWSRLMPIWQRESDQVLFDSVPDTLAEIQENLDYALSVNGAENGRILPMMAPQGPETHTPETLRAVVEAARRLGNGIHTHLVTMAQDVPKMERLWGKGPVQWLEEFGFYDEVFFGAHLGGWNPKQDAPFLAAQKKFTYSHCPSGAGAGGPAILQPFIQALAAGINTNVGLDTHSNDLLENAKLAVLYGRLRHDLGVDGDVPVRRPTVWDMIKCVTLNPANGLGRSDLGRIAVGAKADLTSIDVSGFLSGSGTAPPEPLNNLLYASGLHVRNVMTEGLLQVRDGHLVVDDERKVIERGGAVARKMWAQLKSEGWFTPTAR